MTTLAKTSQKVGSKAWGIPPGYDTYHGSSDASLFSSSLPVLPHEKCMYMFFSDDSHEPFLAHE